MTCYRAAVIISRIRTVALTAFRRLLSQDSLLKVECGADCSMVAFSSCVDDALGEEFRLFWYLKIVFEQYCTVTLAYNHPESLSL